MDRAELERLGATENELKAGLVSVASPGEAVLRASFEALPDPQMLVEAVRDDRGQIVDFTFKEVNRAVCDMLGVARERLIGRSLCESLPEFEESGLLGRYIDCAGTGNPVLIDDYTYTNLALDQTRQCDLRAARVDADLLIILWRDVTERFGLLRRITRSEAQFRLLAENIGEVVTRIGDDGTIMWMSNSVEDALGVPPEYFLGRKSYEIVVADDVTIARRRAARTGEPFVGRARIVVDGAEHWIHFFLKPFYLADDTRDGLVVTFRIIDGEVAIESQVDEARRLQAEADARWHRMMDNAAVAMCISTPAGVFDVLNPAMCEFFGYDEETLKRMTLQELTAPEFLEADLVSTEKLLSGRIDSFRTARQFIHADGHLIWGDVSTSCLRRPDGEVEGFIAQITDITKEVEARRNLTHREEQNRVLAKRLRAQTDRLTSELRSAAEYVASILPKGLDGPVHVTSRYLASRTLAGDCFDYRWIDDDHLFAYLLDVSGHGIESALLSVSIHNLLRSGSLSGGVLKLPDHVLAELNDLFAMENHAGNYFTMWCGVYEASTRTLTYSSGGHPPAFVLGQSQGAVPVTPLSTGGMPVGMFSDSEYHNATVQLAAGETLLLYSDGAYEIPLGDGQFWSVDDFSALCGRIASTPGWTIDNLIDGIRRRTVGGAFDDDLSLVRLDFVD